MPATPFPSDSKFQRSLSDNPSPQFRKFRSRFFSWKTFFALLFFFVLFFCLDFLFSSASFFSSATTTTTSLG
jgi:hypothetical protein